MNKTFSIFYLSKEKSFLFCEKPKSAFIYYKDFRINLLSGTKESYPVKDFLNRLSQLQVNLISKNPLVIHLFYEFGQQMVGNDELVPEKKPLAIAIEYSTYSYKQDLVDCFPEYDYTPEKIDLDVKEYPRFKTYKTKFDKVYEHLLNGDCYQVNLTSQFFFKFAQDKGPYDFIMNLWQEKYNIGAYAHCTYIQSMDKLFMSNSPECLFQVRGKKSSYELYSMPIKGTIKITEHKELQNAWTHLSNSKKEQAELYMITDLLRNDLAKLSLKPAKIVFKKRPLFVPGIVHQYSLINTWVDSKTSLMQILNCLFPGGSITGAPKKRVMKIISQTEDNYRGLYCGSTVLFHKSMRAASINIRSAEVDFSSQELQYGAGGGVTLQSEVQSEFDETYTKMQSFLSLLGVV